MHPLNLWTPGGTCDTSGTSGGCLLAGPGYRLIRWRIPTPFPWLTDAQREAQREETRAMCESEGGTYLAPEAAP